MPKFFVLPEKVKEGKVIIDTEDVLHIKRVLRMSEGDELLICDSTGTDYETKISEIADKTIICDIISEKKSDTESEISITLYQGIPKGSKMELIIQKNTELGVTKIVPVSMKRCVSKLENQKAEEKKVQRWQKIAEEAAKQSGRGIIPEICMPQTLRQAAESMKESDLAFVPYECEEQNGLKPLLKSQSNAKTVSFLIGPEGGFDVSEIEILKEYGISPITLGKRILRTETAGMAVTAMIMYEIGDIN